MLGHALVLHGIEEIERHILSVRINVLYKRNVIYVRTNE